MQLLCKSAATICGGGFLSIRSILQLSRVIHVADCGPTIKQPSSLSERCLAGIDVLPAHVLVCVMVHLFSGVHPLECMLDFPCLLFYHQYANSP